MTWNDLALNPPTEIVKAGSFHAPPPANTPHGPADIWQAKLSHRLGIKTAVNVARSIAVHFETE
jgi:hypothetical protein